MLANVRIVYVQYVQIIGLKAPGNYSASFWSNKFSGLLVERPKPNISMIPVFSGPVEPFFMDLNMPNYLISEKSWNSTHGRHIVFRNSTHLGLPGKRLKTRKEIIGKS